MPKAKALPKKKVAATKHKEKEYNWNVRAQCLDVYHDDRPYSAFKKGPRKVQWPEDDDLPEDGDPLPLFMVDKYRLNHGDVLRFGDYRFAHTFFVHRTPRGKYILVENPDDSGSAQLTVPSEILHDVTDAIAKYHDLLREASVIFHLSNEDKFVTDVLGDGVPNSWDISVTYGFGQPETVVVSQGARDYECDDWNNATLDDIKEFFSGGKTQAKFVVKIDLKGKKFKEYKDKHSGKKKKSLEWSEAFAKLPKPWTVEKGATGLGSTRYRTEWTCKGPASTKDKVKKVIEKFFEGFEVSIE